MCIRDRVTATAETRAVGFHHNQCHPARASIHRRARHHNYVVAMLAVGDERLLPGDHIFVAIEHRAGTDTLQITPGARFEMCIRDRCLAQHIKSELTGEAASIAKLWATEMHGRVVDQCLQFFGGYGFMREYEICRLFADARVQRIYGGTSEIMRELISRNL